MVIAAIMPPELHAGVVTPVTGRVVWPVPLCTGRAPAKGATMRRYACMMCVGGIALVLVGCAVGQVPPATMPVPLTPDPAAIPELLGVVWGSVPLPDMRKIGTRGGLIAYDRPQKIPAELWGMPVRNVGYAFVQNHLVQISVTAKDAPSYQRVVDLLHRTYGAPQRRNADLLEWQVGDLIVGAIVKDTLQGIIFRPTRLDPLTPVSGAPSGHEARGGRGRMPL